MTAHIGVTTTRTARVLHSGRDGVTVAHLRQLLSDCDSAGIPDATKVRVEDRLGEGAYRSGYIEASTTTDAVATDLDEQARMRGSQEAPGER